MGRLGGFVLAGLLALAVLRPAAAAMVGDANVPYRAERTVTVDGRRYIGMVFHEPGHERHEQDLMGFREVFLLDTRRARGDLVLPALKAYVAFPFPPLMADLGAPGLLGAPVEAETIDGIPTRKYHIDHRAADGSRATGFLWLSRDGILMRLEVTVRRAHGGRPLAIDLALAHVEVGPQDPALFVLPGDFTELPAAALAPFLGGGTAQKSAGHP